MGKGLKGNKGTSLKSQKRRVSDGKRWVFRKME